MSTKRQNRITRAISAFRKNGGILRWAEATKLGIHDATLAQLVENGVLDRISRGLYRLADLPSLGNPDLVVVSRKAPQAIICLISALVYHEITTQIPHAIYLAVRRTTVIPKLDYPPLRAYRYATGNFEKGVENHSIDNTPVRIYCPERTIMDCFKYRNKIGLDVAVEALKLYRERGRMKTELLAEYARMNRVRKIVAPYLEAML